MLIVTTQYTYVCIYVYVTSIVISRNFLRSVVTMAMNAAKAVLKPGKSVLLICDVQERFAKAMYEFDRVTQNSAKLVNIFVIQ